MYGGGSTGSLTIFVYDEVGRVTQMRHEDLWTTVLVQLNYGWNLNNTVAGRTEIDNRAGTFTEVTFTYDARDRLIREERDVQSGTGSQPVYDIGYGYDQLGNRKTKTEAAVGTRPAYTTLYTYDTDYPNPFSLPFATRNNRLLKYEIRQGGETGTLLRTVSYTYYKTGNASNITIKDEYVDEATTPGDTADWYYDLALYYFTNGSLRLALNDKWQVGIEGGYLNYTADTAREFRYDSPRERYLAAEYDTNNDPIHPTNWTLLSDPLLTDYADDMPLTDSSLTHGGSTYAANATTRYFGGMGRQTLDAGGGVTNTRYFHGDLIDSNVLATEPGQTPLATASTAYTAFGEPVSHAASGAGVPDDPSTLGTRYQYAGAYGYEAGMLSVTCANTDLPPVMLSHVGARWYQPGIGRFVQRDPIGVGGGINVSIYVENNPTNSFDPDGLQRQGPPLKGDPPIELQPPRFSSIPNTPLGDPTGSGAGQDIRRQLLSNLFCFNLPPSIPPKPIGCPICPPGVKCPRHIRALPLPPLPPPVARPARPVAPPRSDWPSWTGASCFVEGTQVMTPFGFRDIALIDVGDLVCAGSAESHGLLVSPVAAIRDGVCDELISMRICNLEVTCTAEHPFFVEGVGWVRAGELQHGDKLVCLGGRTETISSIRRWQASSPIRVRTITTDKPNTFLISPLMILVHNKNV